MIGEISNGRVFEVSLAQRRSWALLARSARDEHGWVDLHSSGQLVQQLHPLPHIRVEGPLVERAPLDDGVERGLVHLLQRPGNHRVGEHWRDRAYKIGCSSRRLHSPL